MAQTTPIPSQGRKENINFEEDFQNVKDSLTQVASHAKEKTEDLVDEAKEVTAEWQKKVTTYVKDNPLAALGYSALAGFVVALLLRK